MARVTTLASACVLLAVLCGCSNETGDEEDHLVTEPASPWASPGEHYGSRRLDGVPVIRVPDAGEMKFDGVLDEAAWQTSPVYDRFGLSGGVGLLQFPTKLRLMRQGRILWLGLDCTIPPDREGKIPEGTMKRELIEVWIDKGPSYHTFYQIMFRPVGAKIVASWVPEETLKKGFRVKTRFGTDRYTAEVRIDLDAMNDFGEPASPNVGFNLARSCAMGWGSLAGIVGHVHKPNQFWLLDLAETEKPVAPEIAYRDPFRPGVDPRQIADALVAAWEQTDTPHTGKPWARVQAAIDSLKWKINRDDKWAWGAKSQLAVQSWRVLETWREHSAMMPMPKSVRTLAAQLAEYPDGPYPKTRWREDAYISDFDGTAQPYAIFVPEQADAKTPMPLVLFLHGSGTTHRGEGAVFERYWDDRTPYIKVRPKARWCGWYGPLAIRDVMDVIDDVCRHHAVDEDRIYMVGYSAGGFSGPEIAARYPHRFAGVVSISGGMERDQLENLKNLHLVISHGWTDPVVSYNGNQAMSALRLRGVGAPAVSVALPATGHGIALAGYEEQLLKHRRVRVPKSVACLTDEDNPVPLRNYWVSLLRLTRPERQAGVRADLVAAADGRELRVQTANVSELALDVADVAQQNGRPTRLVVDGQKLALPAGDFCKLTREGYHWKAKGAAERPKPDPTRYRTGGLVNLLAEGSLLIVAPEELMPFVEKLKRRRYYGMRPFSSVPVRKDTEVTDEELRANHLILLGSGKLNVVSKRLAKMQEDWPLPVPLEPTSSDDGTGPKMKGVFALYDPAEKAERMIYLSERLVTVVTFNPMNRGRRVWAVFCSEAKAFHEESPVITHGTRRRRQADVTVIDVAKNEAIEQRTLTKEWKPSRRPMRGE